jgi:outer membrane protein assembly factor BamB
MRCKKQDIRVMAAVVALLVMIFGHSPLEAQAASIKETASWPTYLGDDEHTGFNEDETVINPTTAPLLKNLWRFQEGGTVSAQPIVDNQRVYSGAWDGNMYATDLTGHLLWKTAIGITSASNCLPPSVGVAGTATVANVLMKEKQARVVFVGGGNDKFYALNASDGRIIWKKALGASPDHFIWSSTTFFNGSVYIGVASFGDCPLVRGKLMQLDAATGAIQHVFATVPNSCTGGAIWGSPTLDEDAEAVYIATGNPGPCSVAEPFASAIVKLRAKDLSFVSSWQVPANEQIGDGDFGSTPTLFRATIDGVGTNLVGVVNKNGIYYALNRENLAAGPVWKTQIAEKGECPQCGSGSISPSAWDGKTLYVAGGITIIGTRPCTGSLRALNPATGAFLWQDCLNRVVLGAVSAVKGVVVVTGAAPYPAVGPGALLVVDSSSGSSLFTFTDSNMSGGNFYDGAAIANGVIYAGDYAGNLYALDPGENLHSAPFV